MIPFVGPTWPAAVRRHSVRNGNSSRRAVAVFLFLLLALLSVAPTFGQIGPDHSSAMPSPVPAARIDLSAIGYLAPSRMDRLSEDESSVSLDFVDATHVLLTFNPKKMFQRLPTCTPGHQDRLMHAAILELPSGKVVQEADWYLHDRRRYLWPFGPGAFLLRRLNDLYIVDSSLHEKLLLSSPKDLLWVSVTPDDSQIIVETARDASIHDGESASPNSRAKPEPKFEARFLDATTLVARRTIPLDKIVDLTGSSFGYVDLVPKSDIWLIRFGPDPANRRNLARVRSQNTPTVFYSSNNSIVVARCAVRSCNYGATAFTLTGRRLWQQHWNRPRYFATVARNQDSSRFGVSTLRIIPDAGAAAKPGSPAYDPDDVFQLDLAQRDVFQQDIQIIETAGGQPVLTVSVSPAVMSGENFSLSPDGQRLAVLQGAALELFDLPKLSSDEESRFAALKTDVPDLFTLAATSNSTAPLDASSPEVANTKAAETAPGTSLNTPAEEPVSSSSGVDIEEAHRPAPPAPVEDAAPLSASSLTTISEQELEAKIGPVATFKVSTKAVVVDVVVNDAQGHPVKGLRPQDFQLAEDGKAQTVRSFREISDSDESEAADPAPATAAKSHPNVFSNKSRAPDPGAVTMVLFDMLNTPSQDQVYARQQLIKFLESKPKNSQLALCTLSGGATHLRLLQGFTQDETTLLAAARGKKGQQQAVNWQVSAAGTRNAVGTVGVLAQGGRASGFQNLLGALQGMQAEQLVTDTDDRVAITMDSLMQLGRYLSGIPGRKNVVWLSGSFPVAIASPMGVNDAAADNRNYSEKIKRVTNLLAEAQIAMYPVDVRGLVGGGLGADSMGSMGGPPRELAATSSARILAPENTAAPQGLSEMDQQITERNTLTQVATATGGKAFYNSNGIREAIATALEQGSNYYSISYSPTNKIYDGKFRKIKIVLSEKGDSLHYRQGYYAEDANAAGKDADLSRRARAAAMQHGSPPSRQILFSARVVPAGVKRKMNHQQVGEVQLASAKKPVLPSLVDVQHYTIDYSFEGSQLHFLPLENSTYRSVLTLMAASFDREGTMLTGISHVGISNLEPAVYKEVISGEFHLHLEIDVPVEAVSLRLGIQDQMSNHLGTIEIPLPVPPAPDAPRRVQHPLPEIEPD